MPGYLPVTPANSNNHQCDLLDDRGPPAPRPPGAHVCGAHTLVAPCDRSCGGLVPRRGLNASYGSHNDQFATYGTYGSQIAGSGNMNDVLGPLRSPVRDADERRRRRRRRQNLHLCASLGCATIAIHVVKKDAGGAIVGEVTEEDSMVGLTGGRRGTSQAAGSPTARHGVPPSAQCRRDLRLVGRRAPRGRSYRPRRSTSAVAGYLRRYGVEGAARGRHARPRERQQRQDCSGGGLDLLYKSQGRGWGGRTLRAQPWTRSDPG